METVLNVFIFAALFQLCIGDIANLLSYHEVIYASKSHVRDKRSTHEESRIESREFHFTAFNKTLHCHLRPRTDLLSKDFQLRVFGRDGKPRQVKLERDRVFVGQCEGDPKSQIRGVFKDGIFSGTVYYDGQIYGIEDAKPHIPPETREAAETEGRMIIYRATDIKWEDGQNPNGNEPSFCGNSYINPNNVVDHMGERIVVDKVNSVNTGGRYKRASQPSWNTCKAYVVADHKFFQEMGSGNVINTALYILEVMDQVDNIYRTTEFSSYGGVTGLGFEIGKMDIYEFPSSRGFNQGTSNWQALPLLQEFSATTAFRDYCAAHLFTHQSFDGNVLGLAYISPASEGGIGGICSPTARINNRLSSLNTGWSTTRNSGGETILVQQANLVTAHEFGHNWGSEHDPESGGCAPSSRFGNGKYLMYPYSVSGYDSNNNKFSTCSRDTISRVLNSKGPSCFTAKEFDENTLCGNGQIDVENGEVCDAGLLSRLGLDNCCSSFCTFIEGATCSPVNHECCTSNCQTAGPQTVCRQANNVDCLQTAFCNGQDLTCPAAQFKNDTTKCLDEGECRSGVCVPFCESKNLISCACDQLEESCYRCCRASEGAACRPYDAVSLLPNGRPCIAGICQDGQCERTTSTTIQRLFSVLENLSVDSVVRFFKDNIVGTVMVFSLVIWIPLCLLISYKDRHKRKGLERSENIESRMDRALVYDEDKRQVVPAQPAPRQQEGATSPRYRNVNFTDLGGFGSDA